MDDWVGRILDALDRSGLAGDTLFIFTTDHGAAFPRAKSTLYDPGIGTALVMRFPEDAGVEPGRRDELLSNIDLVPTLLEMVGAPVPDEIQGRSFRPLLTGGGYEPRKEVFSEKSFHDVYDPMRSIRTRRFKYIRSFAEIKNLPLPTDIERSIASNELRADALLPRPPEELYDLPNDPAEERNLAGDPAHKLVKDELAGRLEEWMKATDDFLPGPEPEAPPEQWRR
jgi:arylsulfatase A-like enzyme